jgi:hypothetical protein
MARRAFWLPVVRRVDGQSRGNAGDLDIGGEHRGVPAKGQRAIVRGPRPMAGHRHRVRG